VSVRATAPKPVDPERVADNLILRVAGGRSGRTQADLTPKLKPVSGSNPSASRPGRAYRGRDRRSRGLGLGDVLADDREEVDASLAGALYTPREVSMAAVVAEVADGIVRWAGKKSASASSKNRTRPLVTTRPRRVLKQGLAIL
jgi:hypothetical protein